MRSPRSCGIIRPGQRQEAALGLYDYGARFYDPLLGRFVSADTVVPEPGNPQALNRYAYVLNNPLRYVDPTGHEGKEPEKGTEEWYLWFFGNYGVVLTGAEWNIYYMQIVYEAVTRVDTAFQQYGYDAKKAAWFRTLGN